MDQCATHDSDGGRGDIPKGRLDVGRKLQTTRLHALRGDLAIDLAAAREDPIVDKDPRWGVFKPVREYRFDPVRRWRLDFAWPAFSLALEVEGGAWIRGRHTRGKGFLNDIEKYNELAILGWRLLRCTPQDVEAGRHITLVRRALGLS